MTAPLPPSDLGARPAEFVDIAPAAKLHRFYSLGSPTKRFEPIYFDTGPGGRLNAPKGSYGVLYAAESIEGAFAETFLRRPGRTLLSADFVASKGYIELRAIRALRLLKLAGPGLAKAGATAEVVHGGLPYDVPQSWSFAIHQHKSRPDGIAYHARHDDEELCYALFGPLPRSVEEVRRVEVLDSDWFWQLAEHYEIGLAPSGRAFT